MADHDASMFDRLAHDLRGPLTPLQTAAFLLRRENLARERQLELLDIIDRQTARLSRMLQEVADWQSAAQGRLQGRREVNELEILVALASEGLQPMDAVRLELSDELKSAGITGDAQRMTQMFAILLAYAQAQAVDGRPWVAGRYADPGVEVEIGYRTDNRSVDGNPVDFTRPEASPFDDGLGWRLMIANAIAQAHGGTLANDCDPDRGVGVIRVGLPVVASPS